MAHLKVDFFSEVLGKCVSVEVLLPQSTSGQIGLKGEGGAGSYPVLYLLHGKSDDQTIWMRRTSVERYASSLGLAVVMPFADLSFYTDMKCGQRYWTYITEELPRVCRDFFPRISDKREDTFAAGLSMGGYGAMKMGLRLPERFGAVASLSGVLDIAPWVNEKRSDPAAAAYWGSIFGSQEELEGSDNDLLALAKKVSALPETERPKLFACCGTEDFLYRNNLNAVAEMRKAGLTVTFEEGPGCHSWEFWDLWIRRVLQWLPIRH